MHRRMLHEGDKERGKFLLRFFKTGPGQYGHGDRFLGLTVPQVRAVAREYRSLALADLSRLLDSKWHEERLVALVIAVNQFRLGDAVQRKAIYDLYLHKTARINNWDLVDASAPSIVGGYLLNRSRAVLRRLAKSRSLWERRIAIIATQEFIRNGQYDDTLEIAEILLDDDQDLIHKAVGWMLREVGKRDAAVERRFLDRHAARMPRTALRYAIERFAPAVRRRYLSVTRESTAAAPSRRAGKRGSSPRARPEDSRY
ncbi:MAG: DNA alkylation repair protein [Thermoanaerobaculia bacterium]